MWADWWKNRNSTKYVKSAAVTEILFESFDVCCAALNFHENWLLWLRIAEKDAAGGKNLFSLSSLLEVKKKSTRQPATGGFWAQQGKKYAEKKIKILLEFSGEKMRKKYSEFSLNLSSIFSLSLAYQFLIFHRNQKLVFDSSSYFCALSGKKYHFTIHQYAMMAFFSTSIVKFQFSNFYIFSLNSGYERRSPTMTIFNPNSMCVLPYHIIFDFLSHPPTTSTLHIIITQCRSGNQFQFKF